MKQLLILLLVVGTARTLAAQSDEPKADPEFHAAEAVSVTELPLPTVCVTGWGFVVLNALISDTGELQKVEVRRNIDCLGSLAVQGVQLWKFSAATVGDKPIASRVPIVVTFRPPVPASDLVPLPPLTPQSESAVQAAYQPAEMLRAIFPAYQFRGLSNAAGTAVLEVSLSAKGEVEEMKVLRDLQPFTDEEKAVVSSWRFMPATLNGHPVPSKILLAFVTPVPPTSNP